MSIVVRTAQEPAALAAAVRAEIRKLDMTLPIPAVRTMREIVSSTVAQRRFQMTMTSLFAALALVLGMVGLYGVVSYSVACRTREIGLRMELGALPIDVMRWVFSIGLPPVVAGVTAGLALAVGAARALPARSSAWPRSIPRSLPASRFCCSPHRRSRVTFPPAGPLHSI